MQGVIHSKMKKPDIIRRTSPTSSDQFSFPAYTQLNSHYHHLPRYFTYQVLCIYTPCVLLRIYIPPLLNRKFEICVCLSVLPTLTKIFQSLQKNQVPNRSRRWPGYRAKSIDDTHKTSSLGQLSDSFGALRLEGRQRLTRSTIHTTLGYTIIDNINNINNSSTSMVEPQHQYSTYQVQQ